MKIPISFGKFNNQFWKLIDKKMSANKQAENTITEMNRALFDALTGQEFGEKNSKNYLYFYFSITFYLKNQLKH